MKEKDNSDPIGILTYRTMTLLVHISATLNINNSNPYGFRQFSAN
jgi:hypothetical protein